MSGIPRERTCYDDRLPASDNSYVSDLLDKSLLPISVVIPAYNAEKYIATAIASVRAQTRVPAEIIVVDDGSSDRTSEVARAAGVTVIVQANAGPAAARNRGARAAHMPWIALLDADDRWLPEKLEAQCAAAELRPDVGLIACDFFYHEDGRPSESALARHPAYGRITRVAVAPGVVFVPRASAALALPTGFFFLPSATLVRRELLMAFALAERGELASTERYYVPEDTEWFLRVLRATDVIIVERALVRYHIVATGLSSDRGRMRYGDVKLGELVVAAPARYGDDVAAEFQRLRPTLLRAAVTQFLRDGNYAMAATVSGVAFLERPGLVGALWLAASTFGRTSPGRAMLAALRGLWRSSRWIRPNL